MVFLQLCSARETSEITELDFFALLITQTLLLYGFALRFNQLVLIRMDSGDVRVCSVCLWGQTCCSAKDKSIENLKQPIN